MPLPPPTRLARLTSSLLGPTQPRIPVPRIGAPALARAHPRVRPLTGASAAAFGSGAARAFAASGPSPRPFRASPRSPFHASALRSSAPAHGEHYDPPGGWLFGVPPGEKYKREGWEGVWVFGFWGSLGVAVVAYAFKPDSSIQTWALEEARRRLEAEGILPDPEVGRK